MSADTVEFTLQPKQELFCSCSADICFFGGAAGGGKTIGSLMESIRHIDVPGFTCVIFRRTMADVKKPGSLWDESFNIYPYLGGRPNISDKYWKFPSGVKIQFSGLELEADKFDWQGASLCLEIFEEVTHFSETQFWYMLTRSRSTCGVEPYIRATCNPDSDSWVRTLIDWWIGEDGLAIEERSGVLRYLTRLNNEIVWADTREELVDLIPDVAPEDVNSFTFIPSKLQDNPALMKKDPKYLGKLKAQDQVTRKRLLDGNWDIRPSAGLYFQRSWFKEIEERELPDDIQWIRSWDLAATAEEDNPKADSTAGVKMGKSQSTGAYYVYDCNAFLGSPLTVRREIKKTAERDGKDCHITIPKDPAQAGKAQAFDMISMLAGYSAQWVPRLPRRKVNGEPMPSKIAYASAYSAQVEAGNVFVVRGDWNAQYYKELENFPEGHDDRVDASADAFNKLSVTSNEPKFGSG